MIVTDIIKIDKRKSKIISDEDTFALYNSEIRRLNISIESEISIDIQNLIYNNILYKRARERALHLLESMDRTEYQINQKLKEGYYPTSIIERVIAFLKKYDYLNDKRYAVRYRDSYSKTKSCKRISIDLLKKGISKDIIADVLLEYGEDDEKKQIMHLLEKKHYKEVCEDIKQKNKVISFLLRKGYQYDDIFECIYKLSKEN